VLAPSKISSSFSSPFNCLLLIFAHATVSWDSDILHHCAVGRSLEEALCCFDLLKRSHLQHPDSPTVMSSNSPPHGRPGFDINADQRGRIMGSCVSIIVISITFVVLRMLSRKLSRAGYWVRIAVPAQLVGLNNR